MTDDALFCRARIVIAQAIHLLTTHFLHHRVVPDQVTCHDGCHGTPLTFATLGATTGTLLSHLRRHLASKVVEPRLAHFLRLPGCTRQKSTASRQTRPSFYLSQHTRQAACSLTEHQLQQYGLEILVLGLAEALAKAQKVLTKSGIQTYSRPTHSSSPLVPGFVTLVVHGDQLRRNSSLGKVLQHTFSWLQSKNCKLSDHRSP